MNFKDYFKSEYINESSSDFATIEYNGKSYPTTKNVNDIDEVKGTSVRIESGMLVMANMSPKVMLALYNKGNGSYQGLKKNKTIKFSSDSEAFDYLISNRISAPIADKFTSAVFS